MSCKTCGEKQKQRAIHTKKFEVGINKFIEQVKNKIKENTNGEKTKRS